MVVKLNGVRVQKDKNSAFDGYTNVLNDLHKLHKASLKKIFRDRSETKKLLESIIKEIVVYSRPIIPKVDRISGVSKSNQLIPHEINIVLNAPEEITEKINEIRFGLIRCRATPIEARAGFEPANQGFADPAINRSGTAPSR